MKKRILSAAMALMMALGVCACGADAPTSETGSATESQGTAASSGGEEEIVIRVAWWGSQARHDATTAVMDLYTQEHPNVKFVTEFSDFSAYWDKMATQAAAGSLPDIIQMDSSFIRQYTENGLLADLSEYEASGVLDLSDASQSIVDSGRVDGKLTGVCLGVNAPAMIYDKEAAAAAGVEIKNGMTISEFEDAAQKITQATGLKMDAGYISGGTMAEYFMRGVGKNLFQKDRLGVDSAEELTRVFQLLEDSLQGGYSASAEELNSLVGASVEQSLLATGKNWMTFAWSNNLISYNSAAGKEFGMVTYPTWDDDTDKAMYLKPSQFFSVTSNSKVVEECAKFLDFFTNSVEANQILRAERGIPISAAVADAIKPEMDATTQQVFDYIAEITPYCSTYPVPVSTGGSELPDLFNSLYEQMAYGKLTAAQAAEEAFTQGNAILEKANAAA